MILGKHVSKIWRDHFKLMRKYRNKYGTMLVKIEKILYGIVQSAALWFKAITLYLHEFGFEHHSHNQCVITKKTAKREFVLVIYAENILVLGNDDEKITEVLQNFEDEYKSIAINHSYQFTYLGMVLKRLKNRSIEMHTWVYIGSILKAYFARRKVK